MSQECVAGDTRAATAESLGAGAISLVTVIYLVAADSPARYYAAGFSATALMAAGVALLSTFITAVNVTRGIRPRVSLFGYAWAAWTFLVAYWHGLSYSGSQNMLSYISFFLAYVAASCVSSGPALSTFSKRGNRAALVFSVLFLASSLGLVTGLYGTRSAALVAVVALSIHRIGANDERLGRLLTVGTLLILLGVGLSGSRIALAVCLLTVAVGSIARDGKLTRPTWYGLGAACSMLILSVYWTPLRSRFEGGDAGYRIGGVTINTEGRSALWEALLAHVNGVSVFGHGLGVAQDGAGVVTGGLITQPHSDYLRLLIDQGWIGTILFSTFILTICFRSLRAARVVDGTARGIHAASLSLAVALLVTMITDNPLAYSFFLIPLAAVMGTSNGLMGATAMSARKKNCEV